MSVVFESDNNDSEEIELEVYTAEPQESFAAQEAKKLKVDINDPFASIPFKALSKNDKRRAERLIKKLEGVGKAHAKYLTYEQINGYMLYHLASPPYNLDYLTALETEDPTNHSCIHLKASAVCGRGWQWKDTLKTKQAKIDAAEDDDQNKQQVMADHQTKIVQHGIDQQNNQAQASAKDQMAGFNEITGAPKQVTPVPQEVPPMLSPEDQQSFDQKMKKLTAKLMRVQDGLNKKLKSFNITDSFLDTMLKVWIDVEAIGNGFIEIGRTNGGEIGYIGHIPAASMRVRIPRDGYVQWILPGYVGPAPYGLVGPYPGLTFFRNYGDKTTPDIFGKDPQPNEIIHIKKNSAKNNYYGVPDIIAAMGALAGDKFAREYNLDYFENKAVPRYALIVKGAKLSQTAERKILDYFRKEVKGKHHGTLYIPVPASAGANVDVTLEPIEAEMQDGSFHSYRIDNRTEMMLAHRVPPSKLGLPAHGGSSGGGGGGMGNTREDAKTFTEEVVGPEQDRFENKLNLIIEEFTDMFVLELNEYDLVDEETRSRINDRYIRTGTLNSNEIREEIGKPPRKGGDVFMEPGLNSGQDDTTSIFSALSGMPGGQGGPPPPDSATGQDSSMGRPRQTTDGSPKNSSRTRTPANANGLRQSNGAGKDNGRR